MTNESILTLCFFSFDSIEVEKGENEEKSGWVQWYCVVQQGIVEVGM